MKVKIGKTVYDSTIEPVMVILTASEKSNIAGMSEEATMYASFPEGWGTEAEMRTWMLTPGNRPIDYERDFPPPGHPLNLLATRLGELLDEDHWSECEGLILKVCAEWRWQDITSRQKSPLKTK